MSKPAPMRDALLVRALRRASRRLRVLMAEMVRCQLRAPLSDHRHLVLQHRAPCGALVFGHRKAEHLRDVHGIFYAPAGAFLPATSEPEADQEGEE